MYNFTTCEPEHTWAVGLTFHIERRALVQQRPERLLRQTQQAVVAQVELPDAQAWSGGVMGIRKARA